MNPLEYAAIANANAPKVYGFLKEQLRSRFPELTEELENEMATAIRQAWKFRGHTFGSGGREKWVAARIDDGKLSAWVFHSLRGKVPIEEQKDAIDRMLSIHGQLGDCTDDGVFIGEVFVPLKMV